jgi:RND family efflux transporter MFP subunit
MLLMISCRHAAEEGDDDKPPPAAVTCRAAPAAAIDETVEVTGVIAPPPKLDAVVSSPVAGRVGLVAIEEGDDVKAGALLAIIEDPALPAGSLEAKAAVAAAQATKAAADQELARQDRLVTAGIGARKDLDDAKAKAAAAAAELDAANARSGLANTRLSRREIRSPRAGTVLHVWRKLGESVDGTAATPIAEVADLDTLELHAQAPPGALAPLGEGMTARVKVLGIEGTVAATVYRVAPAIDPSTMLGLVRARLQKDIPAIKVGTAATAQILVASRPGVRVPAAALRRSMVGADEVVVCEGGTAHVRTVTVGNRDLPGDNPVEIKDGLKPGEQVVVDHVLGLQDGQPLTAAKAEEPDKPGSAQPEKSTESKDR